MSIKETYTELVQLFEHYSSECDNAESPRTEITSAAGGQGLTRPALLHYGPPAFDDATTTTSEGLECLWG